MAGGKKLSVVKSLQREAKAKARRIGRAKKDSKPSNIKVSSAQRRILKEREAKKEKMKEKKEGQRQAKIKFRAQKKDRKLHKRNSIPERCLHKLDVLHDRWQEKEKVREERKEQGIRLEPTTIENTRVVNDSVVDVDDEELVGAQDEDEFAAFFRGNKEPKLMITTMKKPSARVRAFLKCILKVIPNTFYFKRLGYNISSIVRYASNYDFTGILVLQEKSAQPIGIYCCHLPYGPTFFYRLTNMKLPQEIPGAVDSTDNNPELIFNNFDSWYGQRSMRQLTSLFPRQQQLQYRRCITFHNMRDYVFFRHHRYDFKDNLERVAIKEIGPRFTLKLRWIQKGTFSTKGKYEFMWRADMQINRKLFFMS